MTETNPGPILLGMFCYKCGERIWNGKASCQKCGTDVPSAALDESSPSAPLWPISAAAFGILASSALGLVLGIALSRSFPERPIEQPTDGSGDLITPLNVRDPSAMVMAPWVVERPAPKKAKNGRPNRKGTP